MAAENALNGTRGAAAARARQGTTGGTILLWIVLAGAVAIPMLTSDYRTFQFTQAMIYAIALMGLNLLMGYNGQISLGHGAFFAIGAYTAAIAIDQWAISPYLSIALGGAVAFGFGVLFGIPALRLHGLYLALATLALALVLPQLLRFDAFEGWTGGVQGIFVDKPDVPFGLPLNPDQWLYYLTLAILIVMLWAARNLVSGRIGRALVAIRDNHIAAEAMGINTAYVKSLTFGISALYTGIAGGLSANVVNFVAPDSFDLFVSIVLLVGVVVGGLASISGAVYGGLFIVFVPNWAQDISDAAPWAIYGLFLILLMFVMPDGMAGFVRRVARWVGRAWESGR